MTTAFADELLPPQNLDAERSVLGACLISGGETVARVMRLLRGGAFYHQAHQVIFDAMKALHGCGEPVDLVTLTDALDREDRLDRVGGTAALMHLLDVVPSAANVESYAGIVAEKAFRREAIRLGTALVTSARETDRAVKTSLLQHITSAQRLLESGQTGRQARPIADAMDDLILDLEASSDEKPVGISTGFHDLDRGMGPWEVGWMVILTGRPGMGKTLVLFEIADHVSARYGPVLLASIEMSERSLARRAIASKGRVPGAVLRNGPRAQLDLHWSAIMAARGAYSGRPLYVMDQPTSIAGIKAEAQRIIQRHGSIAMIGVDRIEIMDDVQNSKSEEYDAIRRASNGLLRLAKEIPTVVVPIVQLNRSVEQRADKHPMLSDLRGCGHLEQDARVVVATYRDDYYHGDKSTKPGILEIEVLKINDGAGGSVDLRFLKEFPAIVNAARPGDLACNPHWQDRD